MAANERFSTEGLSTQGFLNGVIRMWQTVMGDRTLYGAEADLARTLIGCVQDMILAGIDVGQPHITEVSLFNTLQPSQQLSVLHEVARGLLIEDEPTPELNSIREATVHVLFRELVGLIECEIDLSRLEGEPDCYLRSLVIRVFHELQYSSNHEIREDFSEEFVARLPPIDCPAIAEWNDLAEELADLILWDRDFEMEAVLVDLSPEKAEMMKDYLGIGQDYFSEVALDPNSEEIKRLRKQIHAICNEPSKPPF
jgi:hypothetical protein